MRFVVLDVETSGLSPVRDRVVWLALAVVEDGTVLERWSTLVHPGTETTRLVNGISLAGMPTFTEIADALCGHLNDTVLVAHNARFDVAFLRQEFARSERTMPDIPVVCTMQLVRRLEVEVASLSLVDSCAAFGIAHLRRHRADEDVEATAQLLAQLLPLAAQRGWRTSEDLVTALLPTRSDGELSIEITFDLDQLLMDWLVREAGWRPEDEDVEAALQRWRTQQRAQREARYALMTPAHSNAHRLWDAVDSRDWRPAAWEPVLEALAASGCDEVADAWKDWTCRCDDSRAGRRRRRELSRQAAAVALEEPDLTRKRLDGFISDLTLAVGESATGCDELIGWYVAHVDRLAALPACGSCGEEGEFSRGCLGRLPCATADLADELSWKIDDYEISDKIFHRRMDVLTPALMRDPNPMPLVRLAKERVRRYVDAGEDATAAEFWRPVQAHLVAVGSLATALREVARAYGHLMYGKRYQMVIDLLAPLSQDAALQSTEDGFWLLDQLARSYERLEQFHQAFSIWRLAIDAGSTEQNTFERLSLALERRGDWPGALAVIDQALARVDQPLESLTKRAARCQKRLAKR